MKIICLGIVSFFITTTAFAAEQSVTLNVPSMNCAACPITVKKALKKVDGVISAEVTYKTKQAFVVFEDESTSVDALIAATTNAGYPSELEL